MEFKRVKSVLIFYALAVIIYLQSCGGTPDYSPKPRGFYRINYPEKKYQEYTGGCPMDFQYPVYAKIVPDSSRDAKPCWLNMQFPAFKVILAKQMYGHESHSNLYKGCLEILLASASATRVR